MRIFFDVDLHLSIQSVGARSPALPIAIKSLDTPAVNIYICSQGQVLDLGESPVLKFGLNLAEPAEIALLVLDATFVRAVDADGLVYYTGTPIFDTTELIEALGEAYSIKCAGEIRVQLASGEIVRTQDIPFVVYRSILAEVGDTAPVGTESYPEVSLIELKANKDQPSGYAALDSDGHLTPSVIPSTVELIATRDVASGHAGLDADNLLIADRIPVDGVTTVIAAGKLAAVGPAQGVISITTEAFTVPAVLDTVTISAPTGSFVAGIYYTIGGGAGTYIYVSATDSTHGVFQNVGGASNAVPTTVIAFPATIQWSGPPGISVTGPTGPASWAASSTIAAWNSGTTTYTGTAPASVVTYLGETWVAVSPVTGTAPGVTGGQWVKVATKGTDGTNGTNGTNGAAAWAASSTIAAWNSGTTTYTGTAPASVVTYAGSTWVAVTPVTGTAPGATGGQWVEVATKGDTGSTGSTGAVGHGLDITGTVANFAALPGSPTVGDIYVTLDTQHAWYWNGTTWDDLGGNGDMTKAVYDTVNRGYVDRAVLADSATAPTASSVYKSGGSGAIKLDELAAPTDVTTLNASTSAHGLLKKLSNVATEYMDGTGAWSTPAGGGAVFAQVKRTTNLTYADTVGIPFEAAVSDTTSMWSSGTNPERLTVAATGIYHVHFNGALLWSPSGSAVGEILVTIVKNVASGFGINEGGLGVMVRCLAENATTVEFEVSGYMALTAGDFVSVMGNVIHDAPDHWEAGGVNTGISTFGGKLGPSPIFSILKVA